MLGYLGLGSNEGDRLGALRAALAALRATPGIAVSAASSAYETAPQGEILDQPDFLNAAVAVDTDLAPEALLAACKAIERDLGREPDSPRHGPRPIDLDVLLLGGIERDAPRPALPHPGIATRRFVIEPLLELEPELTLPDGTPVSSLIEAVRDQPVTRAGPL